MSGTSSSFTLFKFLIIFSLALFPVLAQQKSKESIPTGKAVMWEPVDISQRDLFYGPGGREMQPDLSSITFIRKETGGHNTKYRIKDGSGRVWVAKLGREAQPETAAVRLLWALGYKTEINYLVPTITIPGKGTFKNVRLEARPDEIDRLVEWKWKDNPFIGTNEFQGLKMMMVFFTNWDVVDVQNKVLAVDGVGDKELHYIISDLGATFGRLGNNNMFVIYRLGRKTNNPEEYLEAKFIDHVENGKIDLAYKGKNRDLFNDITVEQGRWLADLLLQLSDKQIEDAFRAANYSPEEVAQLASAVKNRIAELDQATRRQLQAGM
jgi:hypothetical protein